MERSTSWRRFRRRRGIILEEGQEKKLKKNIFVILFCILSFAVFSATPSDEKTEKWIIAPQKFSGKVEYQEMVPTMILQSFPENMTRDISPEEQLFYHEKTQNDKMKELISGLSKYENDKNQLFFKNISKSEKNKQREKIEENIKNQEAEIQKLQAEMLEPVEYHEETRFVEISENFVSDDFLTKIDSNNQKINAVLSGSVSEINGFLYIKAKITILPLEKNPETEDLQVLFSNSNLSYYFHLPIDSRRSCSFLSFSSLILSFLIFFKREIKIIANVIKILRIATVSVNESVA